MFVQLQSIAPRNKIVMFVQLQSIAPRNKSVMFVQLQLTAPRNKSVMFVQLQSILQSVASAKQTTKALLTQFMLLVSFCTSWFLSTTLHA